MSENCFTQVLTSGCLLADADTNPNGIRRPQRRGYQLQPEALPLPDEGRREFPQYEIVSGGDVRRMLAEHGGEDKWFETSRSSTAGEWDTDRYDDDRDEPRDHRTGPTMKAYVEHGYRHARNTGRPVVRLKVAHQAPISIRPRSRNPQIVNVCQTFRFPDNFITQNNANRMAQHQDQSMHRPRPTAEVHRPLPAHLLSPCHSTYRSRSRLGGFFGLYRRQRNMYSQTSRSLLELVECEQNVQQQPLGPTTVPRYNGSTHRTADDALLASSESETSVNGSINIRPRMLQAERKAKLGREQGRIGRAPQVPYFDRAKRIRSCTKLVDGGATMGGHYGRSMKLPVNGSATKPIKYSTKPKTDHRKPNGDDPLESPFVDDPHASITSRNRKAQLSEDIDSLAEEEDIEGTDSDLDPMDEQDNEQGICNEQDEGEDEDDEQEPENDTIDDAFSRRRGHGTVPDGRVAKETVKEGSVGITGIVDKLQDNVWEVCLEGIWDLMDMSSRIDWKAHEKYITVINRKLIEFLKSPRTALCRSACQVSGELFRQAKCTRRPEFDEIVDILLCKTADPNRFIQKDANVALDKLVTYIPTPHTVRAISNRGTIHRNPLVRTATARLLVCICVVSGLDAILGATANTRTRKTILAMLAKFLTDKNLDTRKFGERLYRMLRKHKFFDEYFYKDMDNSLRTNLKRVLKGI